MGIYSIVVALLIILLVPFFELIRKKERKIDFLSFINLIFIIAYGFVPMYIYANSDNIRHWRTMLYNDEMSTNFFIGSLIALFFYLVLIITYYASGRLSFINRAKEHSERVFSKTSQSNLFKPACLLFLVGGFSLLVYMLIVGGFSEYLRVGVILRDDGSYIQHPLMFLKNITPLLCVSSFMFYACIKNSRGTAKFINLLLFFTSFIGSLLIVFHSGGRMTVLIYIMTFPLAKMIFENKMKLRTIILGTILFVTLVLFGDSILKVEAEVTADVSNDSTVDTIMRGVSFPFVNVATVYELFPNEYSFRGGVTDIVNAVGGLIPSRIINIDFLQGESVSVFNTQFYRAGGVMPIDIISFGYMSFGLPGVFLTAIIFGVLVKWTENLLSYKKSLVACTFFVSLMIVYAFRFMYGDPVMFIDAIFRYLVAAIFIWVFYKLRKLPRIVWSRRPV